MSTTTLTPTTLTRARSKSALPTGRVTFGHLLRSEWTKFWTVRSTRWSLVAACVLMLAGIVVAAVQVSQNPIPASFNSIDSGVSGYRFAELAVAVLGVVIITGEYATGMIRSSLMAAPARAPVLWSKTVVFATITFVTMLVAAFTAFFGVQAVVTSHHLQHSLADQHALRTVIGAAMALTGVGVFGTAIGALMRSTAAAISSVAAILFVVPGLVTLLPASIAASINPYLPSSAIGSIATNVHSAHTLRPWIGLAVFAGYTAALVAAAAVRLRTRDA
jgi:ABC-type transport system involved in multi-copper enzyme maturation permease subunit